MASPLADLLDVFADDESADVIQAGTLRTTRGTALFLVSFLTIFYVIDGIGPEVEWLTNENKFLMVLGAGFIWAIVAAADAIARGLATSSTEAARIAAESSFALASTLSCTKTDGPDESGWKAVAVRSPTNGDGPEFLIVKGSEILWAKAAHLKFG